MKNKFLIWLLSLTAGLSVFALSACGANSEPEREPEQSEQPEQPPEEEQPEEEPPAIKLSVTFEEFVTDYIEEARDFVFEYVRPVAVGVKEVVAEKWAVAANENDELTSVYFSLYCKCDSFGRYSETERTLYIDNETLTTPVYLGDIVGGTADMSAVTFKATRQTVFSFNAQTNAESQALAAALYAAHGDTSEFMLFGTRAATRPDRNAYDILLEDGNEYIVKTLEVTCGNGSDYVIIANLADETKIFNAKTKNTYTLNGTVIYAEDYVLTEDYVVPEPEPEPEPIVVTAAELISALDENFSLALASKCFPSSVTISKDKISNDTWYITKNTGGEITQAQYTFIYQYADNNHYFVVGTLKFDTPISAQDLKYGNVGSTTMVRLYRNNFDPTIQNARAGLANAICDTVLGVKENAIRYIIDDGAVTNNHSFRVVEITDSKVEEVVVFIKGASLSDAEYISKLDDSNNYSIEVHDVYAITGELLVVE